MDQYQSHATNHVISKQEFVDFIINKGRRIGHKVQLDGLESLLRVRIVAINFKEQNLPNNDSAACHLLTFH